MPAAEPFIGSVDLWPVNFAPAGWAICNGQLLSISQNQALFALIGVTYGGDGRNTFGVPNLCGRVAIGVGQGPSGLSYGLGQQGGNESAVLNTNNLPAHTHTANGTVTPKAGVGKIELTNCPTGNYPGETAATSPVYTTTANENMGSSPVNININNAGNNQPFSIMQPYLCLYYIIALQGIFPPRP